MAAREWLDDQVNPRITVAGDRLFATEAAFRAFGPYDPFAEGAQQLRRLAGHVCAPSGASAGERLETLDAMAALAMEQAAARCPAAPVAERVLAAYHAVAQALRAAQGHGDALDGHVRTALVRAAARPQAGAA